MCNFGVRSRFLDVIYGVRPPNGSPGKYPIASNPYLELCRSVKLFWIWICGSGGECRLKIFPYLELWWSFVWWGGTIYIISLEGIIRKILLNYFEFGLVDQEEMMSFKDNSYLKLWRPLCSWAKPFVHHLVEGIMRNISVELFLIWTSGSGGYAD